MADGYIGEIRIFPYTYAPEGWLECNGQVLSVQEYQGLYGVIGNIYGGNVSNNTFALPNLQGYVPVGAGQGQGLSQYTFSYKYGTVAETISEAKMPSHSHTITVKFGKNDPSGEGNAVFLSDPVNADWNIPMTRANSTANYSGVKGFSTAAPGNVYLAPATLAMTGGSNGAALNHENRQPFLALRFCICWSGIFPVRP